jgi:hypothetical protein
MLPALWLTIKVNKRQIPIPLFILFPFVLALELIAFVPLLILAIVKKQSLFTRLAFGFYLSRVVLAIIVYGRKFQVKVSENKDKVRIAGKWLPTI